MSAWSELGLEWRRSSASFKLPRVRGQERGAERTRGCEGPLHHVSLALPPPSVVQPEFLKCSGHVTQSCPGLPEPSIPVIRKFAVGGTVGECACRSAWVGACERVDVGAIEGAHRWDMCVWAYGGEVGEWNEKCTAAFGHIAGAARTLRYDFTEEGDRPSLSKTRVRAGRLPVMKLALWIQIGQLRARSLTSVTPVAVVRRGGGGVERARAWARRRGSVDAKEGCVGACHANDVRHRVTRPRHLQSSSPRGTADSLLAVRILKRESSLGQSVHGRSQHLRAARG